METPIQPEPVAVPAGYHDVAPGQLANVVTCLEMLARPQPRAERDEPDWRFSRVEAPAEQWYRELFRRVGEAYLWSSRLLLTPPALRAILDDPRYEVYSFRRGGRDEGLIELDFRCPRECEFTFFGVTTAFVGGGAGRWLMNRALARAWSKPIRRCWLHTCTLDHPAALEFYERSGFRPFKRQVEIFDDPRLTGLFARDTAPHVPLL